MGVLEGPFSHFYLTFGIVEILELSSTKIGAVFPRFENAISGKIGGWLKSRLEHSQESMSEIEI